MTNNMVTTDIVVKNIKIKVININNEEYISLTDLARYADEDEPKYPIQNWIRNKDVILYLGLWEQIHNPNFKGVEFDTFKNKAGFNSFKLSPQKWIKETMARYANNDDPKILIQTWMRSADVIEFLSLWERINNDSFKGRQIPTFEKDSGKHRFYMSPQKWIKETNAFGSVTPTFAGTTANIQVKNDVCN